MINDKTNGFIGKSYLTNNSGLCSVIEYKSYHKVLVRFEETGNVLETSIGNLKKGLVKDRQKPKGSHLIGAVFKSKRFGNFTIIDYIDANNVKIVFSNTGYARTAKLCYIKSGCVSDVTVPTFYGVGCIGEGFDLGSPLLNEKYQKIWSRMLERVYSNTRETIHLPYRDCKVSDNFKNLTKFKIWCSKQVGFDGVDEKGKSFNLDKDILFKGNRLYSEDTCCFVPQEINAIFVRSTERRGLYPLGVHKDEKSKKFVATLHSSGCLGRFSSVEEAFSVYKKAKESHIKDVANKWKNQIDDRVYTVLMEYTVNITD